MFKIVAFGQICNLEQISLKVLFYDIFELVAKCVKDEQEQMK